MNRSTGGRWVVALLLAITSPAVAGEVSVVPALPRIGEGGAGNQISAVSGDGTTALVQTYQGNSPASSLWTRTGGHVEITPGVTGSIFATDVNANGTVAAGFGFVSGAADSRAVRWT